MSFNFFKFLKILHFVTVRDILWLYCIYVTLHCHFWNFETSCLCLLFLVITLLHFSIWNWSFDYAKQCTVIFRVEVSMLLWNCGTTCHTTCNISVGCTIKVYIFVFVTSVHLLMFYLVITLPLDIRRIFTVLFSENDISPVRYQILFSIVPGTYIQLQVIICFWIYPDF